MLDELVIEQAEFRDPTEVWRRRKLPTVTHERGKTSFGDHASAPEKLWLTKILKAAVSAKTGRRV